MLWQDSQASWFKVEDTDQSRYVEGSVEECQGYKDYGLIGMKARRSVVLTNLIFNHKD